MASRPKNAKEIRERAKINMAKAHLEIKYGLEFEDILKRYPEKTETLDYLLYQIAVCEQLGYSVSTETIEDWVETEDLSKIRIEARSIKFAS